MQEYRLVFEDRHLFVYIEDRKWLLDTGAPRSFGNIQSINIGNREFSLTDNFMGMNSQKLSDFFKCPINGIIGVDILNNYDVIIDVPTGKISFSDEQIDFSGIVIPLELIMGIPLFKVEILGQEHRMFFDTGAQISFFENQNLKSFPDAGLFDDFHPSIGEFQVQTYRVALQLGSVTHIVQCGSLPDVLGNMINFAGAEGVIGNEIIKDRKIGYLPRRGEIVLA
ncbi:MAG: hypothetical protein KKD05_05175 [Candidatus Omnitrophica bacterium]|nr:hypothetical protein [Candidatus Omnitrophota bacterium]